MTQKRVLMLVYGNAKDDPRVYREALTLTTLGYQVTVFGAARQGNVPVVENINGIRVLTLPVFTDFGIIPVLSMIYRLIRGRIGNITPDFPSDSHRLRSTFTLIFYNLWVLRFAFGEKYDVLHTHDYHPLPSAYLLSSLKKPKTIHDVHESIDVNMGNTWVTKRVFKMQVAYIKRADAVITVGNRLLKSLQNHGAKNVYLIGNWRSMTEYSANPERVEQIREQFKFDQYRFVISYLGLLLPERTLSPLLEAVAKSPDIALIIGGRGPLLEEVENYASQYQNIFMLGWIPIDEVGLYTRAGDVIYCCIDANMTHQAYYVVPNKLFESFVAGNALIAVAGLGEMAEILEESNSGILLKTVTTETILEAFNELRSKMTLDKLKENAYNARNLYTWEIAEERLANLYETLIGKSL